MNRYVLITIYTNAFGNRVAHIFENEDDENPKYFTSVEDAKKEMGASEFFDYVLLNLDTLESEVI